MTRIHTKEAAEAILRELPSVVGAFVREDVNGHPREVHLLISPGPDPASLARDVRALLEERLGVTVDQRVISIAQLAAPPAPRAAPEFDPVPVSGDPVGARRRPEPRLVYLGFESLVRESQVRVRVRLAWGDEDFVGEATELDGGQGRVRAAAAAALRAANAACKGRLTIQLESAAVVQALGRSYALVTARAASERLGRRPIALTGAQPLDYGEEGAAALAALMACNRVIGLGLDREVAAS